MATETGGRGEAGRRGADVRSDLFAAVEPRKGGGIDLDLRSKVELYYGEATRDLVLATLKELGVANARVEIEDQGALPFAIMARVEAAAKRAGLGGTHKARPERQGAPVVAMRDRLRRSRLYLPGSEPKYFVSAGLHRPDAVILDLEDSVHPDEKDAARILVRNALRAVDFGGCERMVRINQLPLGLKDLEEIVPETPDLILIPKVETADQVREADEKIRGILEHGGQAHSIWLMPILESALGVENGFAIAGASPRIVAMTVGLEDLTADLGVVKTPEGAETLYARSRLVNLARAARVQAIDSVYGDVEDLEGLLAYGRRSRAMGFEGMGCVHPRQIEVVHEAFAPSAAEIERAVRIVAAFDEASARGLGVVSLGSKMIDPPVVSRAQKLVKQARDMGLLPKD